MGTLIGFDLPKLAADYGLRHLLETGTGSGSSLAHAALACDAQGAPLFTKLISCEIVPAIAQNAYMRFRGNPRVEILSCTSQMFLHIILCEISETEPILFWLDAHFPGADSHLSAWGDEPNASVRLPAKTELDIIKNFRPVNNDVIIMDDARIWLDGDFSAGRLPDDVRPFCPVERNIDFVHDLFDATHDIKVLTRDHGYVVITPKRDQSE